MVVSSGIVRRGQASAGGNATTVAPCFLLLCGAHSAAVQAEWLYREEAIMGTRCAVGLGYRHAKGEAAMESVFAACGASTC
jgi:hypothetical protein